MKKNHKEESYDIGTEACYVKQCGTVRPAFVWEAHRDSEITQLMYVYIPIGLEREHEIQGSVLARFGSHQLATCFLAVANEKLQMGYVRTACTCIIPEEARKHGGRAEVLATWEALLLDHSLPPCYRMEVQHVVISEDERVWDALKKTVENVSGSRFNDAVTAIENL